MNRCLSLFGAVEKVKRRDWKEVSEKREERVWMSIEDLCEYVSTLF